MHSYVWLPELNIKCFFSVVPYNKNNNKNFYTESEVELTVGEVLKGVVKADSQRLYWTFLFKTVFRIRLI